MDFSLIDSLRDEEIKEKYNEILENDGNEYIACYWYMRCTNGRSGISKSNSFSCAAGTRCYGSTVFTNDGVIHEFCGTYGYGCSNT